MFHVEHFSQGDDKSKVDSMLNELKGRLAGFDT